MRPLLLLLLGCGLLACTTPARQLDLTDAAPVPLIRLNQLGYYPSATKVFTVTPAPEATTFDVVDSTGTVVYEGALSPPQDWTALAGETVKTGDFSQLNGVGTYRLFVPGVGFSYPFAISQRVYAAAFPAALKSFYLQRMSMPLEARYAGPYARPAGHPDDAVRYHPSSGKPDNGPVSSPGGWYDAGDYNKYIVNGAFSTGMMLQLAEQYPDFVGFDDLNIPESGNGRSDFLDEMKYELDWMLTMQDSDGGLFHKLTTLAFEGMDKMPNEAVSPRYIVGKGTTATLDFAACAALAARVFHDYDPAYAERLLTAAEAAWDWATRNPAVAFTNPADVSTGQYGDANFDDEWAWAAAELYLSTGEAAYLDNFRALTTRFRFVPGETWTGQMTNLATYSLLTNADRVPTELARPLADAVIGCADTLLIAMQTLAYHQPVDSFHWGSTSDVLGGAMVLANAYRLSGEERYLQGARQATDWVFGHNATGFSFLTGHGHRTPLHIHHRPSAADGIGAPVPGLLAGGPNPKQQDHEWATYPENAAPMQSYVDQEGSFASNEICLNWNAPLVYVLGFLEAER